MSTGAQSRVDKLPRELQQLIYEHETITIPIEEDIEETLTNMPGEDYHLMVYDYRTIRKKLKIKHYKDTNKTNRKIDKFINDHIKPLIKTYQEIKKIISGLAADRYDISPENYILHADANEPPPNHDFKLNNMNTIEQKLKEIIPRFSRQLYTVQIQFNTSLSPHIIEFLNDVIKKINKVLLKPLPLIGDTKLLRARSATPAKKSTRCCQCKSRSRLSRIRSTRKTRSL